MDTQSCSTIQKRIQLLSWNGLSNEEESAWEGNKCEETLPPLDPTMTTTNQGISELVIEKPIKNQQKRAKC